MTAAVRIADRYVLEAELGRGGMARVFRARDEQLGRPVAVKLLAESLALDEDIRERFVREARLAARVQHANVVAVYDAGEADGQPFIVTELVEGETLADHVARRGRLPADEAAHLARDAALGLERAHAAGLIHRDVKPQNLLLAGDGSLKIADFGIARAGEATGVTELGTILGTAAYIAPEQARGERVTAAADIYGLGAVLYQLLAGRPPHAFRSIAELADHDGRPPVRPVRELAPDVPPDLEQLTMRCLALDPRYRPTAGEVAAALSGVRSGEAAPTLVAPAAPSTARVLGRSRRRLVRTAVAVAIAAAAVGVGVAATGGGGRPSGDVGPVPRGETPAQDARNLAAWIREHAAE